MSHRERILESVYALPELPSSAARVVQLVQDPDVEISDLMRAIEYDQGLTSNVLRIANSAYFAGPQQISSLRNAIVRLGMNRIYQLVMTSAFSGLARKPICGYDLSSGALLKHSVFVAICSEEIAKVANITVPPQTFTAGLLHDVGKVVLGTFIEVDVGPLMTLVTEKRVPFEEAERSILGIDHAEVGSVLLENWKLPTEIIDAVRWHHNPNEFSGDTSIVDLVHVADSLSMESGIGIGIDGLNYMPSSKAVTRLKLKEIAEEEAVCHTLSALEDLGDLFGPDSGRE